MHFINGKKLSVATKIVLGCAAAVLAVTCLAIRLPALFADGGDTLATWAAGMALPNGAKAALQEGYGDGEEPPDDVSALAPAASSSPSSKTEEDELSSSSLSSGENLFFFCPVGPARLKIRYGYDIVQGRV